MRYLSRAYDYFGAHKEANRAEMEKERALQRLLFPVLLIPLGVVLGRMLGLTDKGIFGIYTILPIVYGVFGGGIYYIYLKKHPTGGVGLQYLFFILDPIATEAAIAYEPKAFCWTAILLLAIIARTGIRYGMRTLMLTWVSAIGGAFLLYLVTLEREAWQDNKNTYLVVIAALASVYLFKSVIQAQARSRILELERLKIAALADQTKARDEFLSYVSHELRSPLQSLVSTLELLEVRKGRVDPDSIKRIRRSARNLTTQLGDLLTEAHGRAGELVIEPSPVQARDIFIGALEATEQLATEKGLEFTSTFPCQADTLVLLDAVRVAQIAENLLINAVKYTPTGSINFSIDEVDAVRGLLVFSITDTGVGIAEHDQDTIFAPYRRLAGNVPGTFSVGIGLAVVKTLLHAMEGKLHLASRLGQGSKFTVTIPFNVPKGFDLSCKRGRILIVDDRQDVLDALGALTAALGYSIDTALSAEEARELLVAYKYQTILMDLDMPSISGEDFAREIRSGRGLNSDTRIVAMTAGDARISATDSPFEHLIRKPVSADLLRHTLETPF